MIDTAPDAGAPLAGERAFVRARSTTWEDLDAILVRASGTRLRKVPRDDVKRLPALYREACADLAAAESARYGAPLVAYLRGLVASAHALLYGRLGRVPGQRSSAVRRAWLGAFPRKVRAHKGAMGLAALLFFLPLALGLGLTLRDPTFAHRIVPEAQLRPLSEAYRQGFGDGRGGGDSTFMAGFYLYNNVGIALRCFALGIFGGLGSAFYLVYNGLTIGAIFGYVASQGAGTNIATFVASHGSLELGAIVLAGGSGLALGWSVISPGRLTRRESLQRTARDVFVIVAGAAVMLVLAASIEGFWSASGAPAATKLTVGAALFVLLAAYLTLAGRTEEDA